MKHSTLSLLAIACLLLAACQDRRDPVKPTTGSASGIASAVLAA